MISMCPSYVRGGIGLSVGEVYMVLQRASTRSAADAAEDNQETGPSTIA
jgi:hypothetical protein